MPMLRDQVQSVFPGMIVQNGFYTVVQYYDNSGYIITDVGLWSSELGFLKDELLLAITLSKPAFVWLYYSSFNLTICK
jgi:hypothetical protein